MKAFILQHYQDYPQSELQDFFKFLYQGEFGPGHLITDPEKNFNYLQTEFERLDNTPKEPIIDVLQLHLCRLHLQALSQTPLAITTLQRFFEISAKELQGTVTDYYKKIQTLRDLCVAGELPFDPKAVDEFKTKIDENPTNPVHHSEAFRTAYQPAYRVVEKRFCDFLSLFAAIDQLMHEKEQLVVAIDGDCAAGKTTLSELLSQVYDCNIVHMDHFFLRPEQRTKERLAMPGGNVDYERFREEVLAKVKMGESFAYRPFNCTSGEFDAPISVSNKQLTIVEGSYSQHPELVGEYDLKVFLTIPEEVQLERILKRNGKVMCAKFKEMWIPMEKQYAEAFGIEAHSDLVFGYLGK